MAAKKTTVRLTNGRLTSEFDVNHAELLLGRESGWELADGAWKMENGSLVRVPKKSR